MRCASARVEGVGVKGQEYVAECRAGAGLAGGGKAGGDV